jgi:hypothetical protein
MCFDYSTSAINHLIAYRRYLNLLLKHRDILERPHIIIIFVSYQQKAENYTINDKKNEISTFSLDFLVRVAELNCRVICCGFYWH